MVWFRLLSVGSEPEYLFVDYPLRSYSPTYPKDNKCPQMAHPPLYLRWYLKLVLPQECRVPLFHRL